MLRNPLMPQTYVLHHSPYGPLMVHRHWLSLPDIIQAHRNVRQRDWLDGDPDRRSTINARRRLADPYPQRRAL